MCKNLIYLVTFFISGHIIAQRNSEYPPTDLFSEIQIPQIISNSYKAANDTLFLFDGRYMAGTGINSTTISFLNEDLDDNIFDTLYSNKPLYPQKAAFIQNFKAYSPGDTINFFSSISFFNPPDMANNWLSVGPIQIPAEGATLSWKHNYPNPKFRDGYKVYIGTVGIGSSNFTSPPIFTVSDNDPSTVTDTVYSPRIQFYRRSVDIGSYAGKSVYIAIQHDAIDQDRFFIDDILIQEFPATSTKEVKNKEEEISIYPNPSDGIFNVQFNSPSARKVELYDFLGVQVFAYMNTSETTSIDLSGKVPGIYTVKIVSENNEVMIREIIVVNP